MEKRITFTPGPWYVSLTPDRDEEGWVGPEVYDRDLGVFAVLDGEPETIAQPWSEANARLIAAAPDLLEVLEWLMEEFDRRELGGEAVFCGSDMVQVRTVIRKARGEE